MPPKTQKVKSKRKLKPKRKLKSVKKSNLDTHRFNFGNVKDIELNIPSGLGEDKKWAAMVSDKNVAKLIREMSLPRTKSKSQLLYEAARRLLPEPSGRTQEPDICYEGFLAKSLLIRARKVAEAEYKAAKAKGNLQEEHDLDIRIGYINELKNKLNYEGEMTCGSWLDDKGHEKDL